MLKVIPFWTTLDNAVTDSCLGDCSGWIVLTSKTRSVNGLPTSAQLGSLACNMVVGCILNVPGIARAPQGAVLVMTDADLA